MDNQAIEQTAVTALKDRINLTDYLSSFIADNDKEPSWDGHIYIYKSASKRKDNLEGRIPAQVKGHESSDFSMDEITYSHLSAVDLRNFLNDGGAMLFVVYIRKNDDETEFEKKPYYIELTPVRIQELLSRCKVPNGNPKITLKALPKNKDEFASIVLNCYHHCKRQKSYANAKLPSLEELEKNHLLESVKIFISGYSPKYRGPLAWLHADSYVYAEVKGNPIPQPTPGTLLHKVCAMDKKMVVSIGDKIYYDKCHIVADEESTVWYFGKGLSITIYSDNKRPTKINYKSPDALYDYVVDQPFILAAIDNKHFDVDDTRFEFDLAKADLDGFDPNAIRQALPYYQHIAEALKQQGVTESLSLASLSDRDFMILSDIAAALLDGKPMTGMNNSGSSYVGITAGNIKLAFYLAPNQDMPEAYDLYNISECPGTFVSGPSYEEGIPVPACAVYMEKELEEIANIRFDEFLPAYKKFQPSSQLNDVINIMLLRLINAYDSTNPERKERRAVLLKTAKEFSDYLLTIQSFSRPIALLNDLQIAKRQRALTDKEKGQLFELIEQANGDHKILAGIYILLDRKDTASVHLNQLPEAERAEFFEFPIYHLMEMEDVSNG